MARWRPVRGEIQRFDTSLDTVEKILALFSEHRVLGRYSVHGDVVNVELAVTGRRARVAVLAETGEAVPGPALSEFVTTLYSSLRKSEVLFGRHVAYRAIDLGEVDIADDDIDAYVGDVEDLDERALPDPWPSLTIGVLIAALPMLTGRHRIPAGVSSIEDAAVVLSPSHFSSFDTFETGIVIVDARDGKFAITVRDEQTMFSWDWTDDLVTFPWFVDIATAQTFVHAELGAGAVVARMTEVLPGSDVEALYGILEGSVEDAPAKLAKALNLPVAAMHYLFRPKRAPYEPELEHALDGVEGARIFTPSGFLSSVQKAVGLEVSGHGHMPRAWKLYRELYLERPWLVSAVATAQAGIGGALMMYSLRPDVRERGAKFAGGVGVALFVNAISRVVTTRLVERAMEKAEATPVRVESRDWYDDDVD